VVSVLPRLQVATMNVRGAQKGILTTVITMNTVTNRDANNGHNRIRRGGKLLYGDLIMERSP